MPGYAAEAVEYVVSAQLFQGMSDGRFAPEGNMDRAMFATVLSRLYGADGHLYGLGGILSFPAIRPSAGG